MIYNWVVIPKVHSANLELIMVKMVLASASPHTRKRTLGFVVGLGGSVNSSSAPLAQ